jgi:hypothetical protein
MDAGVIAFIDSPASARRMNRFTGTRATICLIAAGKPSFAGELTASDMVR